MSDLTIANHVYINQATKEALKSLARDWIDAVNSGCSDGMDPAAKKSLATQELAKIFPNLSEIPDFKKLPWKSDCVAIIKECLGDTENKDILESALQGFFFNEVLTKHQQRSRENENGVIDDGSGVDTTRTRSSRLMVAVDQKSIMYLPTLQIFLATTYPERFGSLYSNMEEIQRASEVAVEQKDTIESMLMPMNQLLGLNDNNGLTVKDIINTLKDKQKSLGGAESNPYEQEMPEEEFVDLSRVVKNLSIPIYLQGAQLSGRQLLALSDLIANKAEGKRNELYLNPLQQELLEVAKAAQAEGAEKEGIDPFPATEVTKGTISIQTEPQKTAANGR